MDERSHGGPAIQSEPYVDKRAKALTRSGNPGTSVNRLKTQGQVAKP